MATIFNSSILNSAILDSVILHKALTQTSLIWLKLIHSDSTWWWQPSWILPLGIQIFCTKKTSLIHSDSTWWWQSSWILPCWIQRMPSWNSDALLSSLRFTQKHSHSILTLTQTNSMWLKLIHSHSTWWWQPSWILPLWIQIFCTKKTSLIHSDSTWWWQPFWILQCWIQRLPSWIQMTCYLLSDSLKNTLTPFWLWLKLIQSDSNSFILT